MRAYCIANVEVTDPDTYERYRSQVVAIVEKFGGRYLARGGRAEAKEGGLQPHRVVILEFPDLDTAKRWYDSPEYQAIIGYRTKASRTDLIMVEGVQG